MSLFFWLTGISLPAQTVKIPPYPVTLHQTATDLHRVFLAIQKQCAARFSYDKKIAQNISITAVDYTDTPLNEVLGHLKQFARLSFIAEGNNIVVQIFEKKKPIDKDTTLVAGRVVDDETGDPLINATVTIGTHQLISDANGAFKITLEQGTYAATVSSVGYTIKKITGIELNKRPFLELNITLTRQKDQLAGVVVTSSVRKESIASHFLRQKNAASLTDGISSEQIARTPDNNMGQVLKRITGITTIDDRYVMVRGLGDRYNQGMIDGIVVPSTSMNRRDFSFDAIPQEVVSNVVVNKTATPDVSAEFSGGQISVNTLDIPVNSFTIIGLGLGMNDQGTGKDFYRLGRWGKYDFFGFEDGSRKLKTKIISWQFPGSGNDVPPPGEPGNGSDEGRAFDGDREVPYNSFDAIAQSKRISADGLRLYRYKTLPLYNGRITLGRVYPLNDKGLRIGFVAGASLRNSQTVVPYNNVRGQLNGVSYLDSVSTDPDQARAMHGSGLTYRHNSTLGLVLNTGLQGQRFKVAFKNLFTSVLNDEYSERYMYDFAVVSDVRTDQPSKVLFQQPELTQVRQHLLEGEQKTLSGLNIDYGAGIIKIRQQIRDQRIMNYSRITVDGTGYYQEPFIYSASQTGESAISKPQRFWTFVDETDYNWKLILSRQFGADKKISSLLKLGYNGWYKSRTLNTVMLTMYTSRVNNGYKFRSSYDYLFNPANMGAGAGQAYYNAITLNNVLFKGDLKNHSVYAMADQRFFKKWRLIYGLRAEYFNLSSKDDDFLRKRYGGEIPFWAYRPNYFNDRELKEKDWRLLPSANLVYSLTPKVNIRGAYSRTVIRPDFRETSYFGMYSFDLNATITGKKLVSTIVDNLDIRFEWYPSPTEIFTVGGFYKHLDKPIELMADPAGARYYMFINQDHAKNAGLETEFRKSLDFINASADWLKDFFLFGNAALIRSKVIQATYPVAGTLPDGSEAWKYYTDTGSVARPLIGQVPWMINTGLAYQGDLWGITASFNRTGYRTNLVNLNPGETEYEQGRNLLDLQVYARFLKQQLEIKINCSNLLNEYRFYYQNLQAYESSNTAEGNFAGWKLKGGHSVAYEKEKGDRITYREKSGRNFSVAVTYKF
ncbi:TonB-dependent receptor [Niabella beijingensis]|uniref:TonB-dependent receptor n=1 Tax=Niabella beijingensis TaxID=2872700 RepID=UPI001CBF0F14|nr:TonB-dependent receptor [Niabella beijingensis]MBZ4188007.1 TonB-dependent receptor [Niabella beijingensis]